MCTCGCTHLIIYLFLPDLLDHIIPLYGCYIISSLAFSVLHVSPLKLYISIILNRGASCFQCRIEFKALASVVRLPLLLRIQAIGTPPES